jgi:putative membrane protein
MTLVAHFLVALVALLHLFFMYLEMFLWTKPYGRHVFGLSRELAESSAKLAANQGLYNGFLAAGLVWGLWTRDPRIMLFFLGCVIVAGIYGAITVKRSILWVQALPGVLAGIAVVAAYR